MSPQPLDVVGFRSGTRDPLGDPMEAVSALIEGVCKGWSHTGCIREPAAEGRGATLIHCTIDRQGNGVQTADLASVLEEYPPGSEAYLFRLLPAVRARIDLFAFYKLCGDCDGFVSYDIGALFRFLLPDLIVAQLEPGELKSMVCSVWVATALETSGATTGVTPWRMRPDDVLGLPLYQAPERLL